MLIHKRFARHYFSHRVSCRVTVLGCLTLAACASATDAADTERTASAVGGADVGRRIANPNDVFTTRLVRQANPATTAEKLVARFENPVPSPDGRLIFDHARVSSADETSPKVSTFSVAVTVPPTTSGYDTSTGKVASTFLDEMVVRDATGTPVVATLTDVSGGAITADSQLAWGGATSEQMTLGNDPRLVGGGSSVRVLAGNATKNCFRADPATIVVSPLGTYECRRLLVFAPGRTEAEAVSDAKPHRTYVAQIGVLVESHQADGTRLATPVIKGARFLKEFRALTEKATNAATELHSPAIELTVTADSRLLFGKDAGPNFTFSETPWAPNTWEPYRSVTCLSKRTNETCPGNDRVSGVANMMIIGRTVELRDRYPIARFPMKNYDGSAYVGAQVNTGVVGTKLTGTYPWVSFDGSDLFFNSSERSVRTVFGKNTRGVLKHVDTQANVARARYCIESAAGDTSGRSVPDVTDTDTNNYACAQFDGIRQTLAIGTGGGLWRAFPETSEPLLPFSPRTPLYMMLDHNQLLGNIVDDKFNSTAATGDLRYRHVYSEVSLDDFVDGSFAAVFHMNEALRPNGNKEAPLLTDVTPDTSGNNYTLTMSEVAAKFPFQHDDNRDLPGRVNPGFLGRAVYLGRSGKLEASTAEGPLSNPQSKLTVELAIKPLSDLTGDVKVLELPKYFKLSTRKLSSGRLIPIVTLYHGNTEQTRELTGATIAMNEWTHLVTTVDLDGDRKLRAYVNGSLAFTSAAAFASLSDAGVPNIRRTSAGGLILGPNEPSGSSTDAYLLDEVAISTVVRDDEYIAGAAYRAPTVDFDAADSAANGPSLLSDTGALPTGLKPQDLRIPKKVFAAIDEANARANITKSALSRKARFGKFRALGAKLFSDNILSVKADDSGNNGRSCATCHGANGDERLAAGGLRGAALPVNIPTVVNRAFSRRQFFDQRSPSLVDQSLIPIENVSEMNGNVAAILRAIQGGAKASGETTTYLAAFQDAFALSTAEKVSADHLAMVLVAFELSLLRGDSAVDKIRATGVADGADSARIAQIAKGDLLFNGRARCVACHSGGNFSDEQRHRVASDGLAVKTPTLRGVKRLGEGGVGYFHDGKLADLDAVLEHYNKGGCKEEDTSATCDPELHALGLTVDEKAALKAFVEAL